MSNGKTAKQLAQETHQAVFGVPGTEEKGMAGDIKDIKELVTVKFTAQQKEIDGVKSKVNKIIGALTASSAIGGAVFGGIKLFG